MSNAALVAHGTRVLEFGRKVPNLGRIGELTLAILKMLRSQDWRDYTDGSGTYHFLKGEFDYFLAEQAVDARDLPRLYFQPAERVELLEAMDAARQQEPRYRRSFETVIEAHPNGSLSANWTRYGWADVKHPVGSRTVARVRTGHTWEAEARANRRKRLQSLNGSWTRVQAIVRATERFSDDEVRAVIDALRDKLKRAPGRPRGTDPHQAWRRVAKANEWSPTKCAKVWGIKVNNARQRLARLRSS